MTEPIESLAASGLTSNPFDIIEQASIDLVAGALRFAMRFRVQSGISYTDMNSMQIYWDRIKEAYRVLDEASAEEVDALRKISHIYHDMDSSLSKIEKLQHESDEIKTEFNVEVPYVSEEFEKLLYGEGSPMQKRLEELRNLYTEYKFTPDELKMCLDTLAYGYEEANEMYYLYEDSSERVKFMVDELKFDDHDCNYLLSYIGSIKK